MMLFEECSSSWRLQFQLSSEGREIRVYGSAKSRSRVVTNSFDNCDSGLAVTVSLRVQLKTVIGS